MKKGDELGRKDLTSDLRQLNCDVSGHWYGEGWVYDATQVLSRKWRRRPAMASSVSGDQSLSLSSTSGRTTTRFSVGSPDGDDVMALPSLVMTGTGERMSFAYGVFVDI